MENKPGLAAISLVIFINVQFSYLLPQRLGHLTLSAHTKHTSPCRCLLSPHQRHHSQQEGRKYTVLSGLLHTETTGCYKTAQQSLLCLVVDLRLGLSHTGITKYTQELFPCL